MYYASFANLVMHIAPEGAKGTAEVTQPFRPTIILSPNTSKSCNKLCIRIDTCCVTCYETRPAHI
jgi:hypothetical protein